MALAAPVAVDLAVDCRTVAAAAPMALAAPVAVDLAVDCRTVAAAAPMALHALDAATPMDVDAFSDQRLLHGVSHVQHVASTLIDYAAPMLGDFATAAPIALASMILDAASKAVDCISLQVDAVQGAAEHAQDSTEALQRASGPEAAEHATPKPVVIQKCACPCCFDSFLVGRHLTRYPHPEGECKVYPPFAGSVFRCLPRDYLVDPVVRVYSQLPERLSDIK